jgi:hypothetical protein|tara:strand:+ start:47 stop:433 length:387 start_codon:yes stop_codon:yes gene_type:complete
MKKFTKILEDKDREIEFESDDLKDGLSADIEELDDVLSKDELKDKLGGSWEIVSIIDVSVEEPVNENLKPIIINAEVGNRQIKRGEYIYITAQIKKPGQSTAYHHSQMGVIKVRVIDIYNTMLVLNNL